MDYSESIPASLACPACGRTFTADLWQIVDAAARPDLIDRLRNGTLHRIACPHCGHSVDADAPLLVYVPPTADADARLIFSPARSTSAEEDQRHAVELLTRLRNASGDAWRDEWLERIANVPRELLPLALSDDPEQALRRLVDLLQQFVTAPTWAESRRILEQRPELLSPVADMLLEDLSAAARAQGDENAQRIFDEHLALLRRCHEVGIEQAFAEKTTTPAPSGITAESANLPPEIAQALREVLEQLAVAGVEVRSHEDLERALQEHPDLLEKLMRAAADAGGLVVPPAFAADVQIAAEALVRYERSSDIEALDEAVAAWERILNHAEFGRTEQWFCRIVLNNAGGAYLRRYWRQGRVSDLNSALHLWETALSTSSSDISVRSAILNNLGNGLRARYARTGNLADLDTAIARFEEALVAVPFDTPGRPKILNNLGNGLRDRYARTSTRADLQAAQEAFRTACVSGLETSLEDVLRAGRNWGDWTFNRHAWDETVAAYTYAMQAVRRLFAIQYRREEKLLWLRDAQEVPVRLAYAFIQQRQPEQALSALETGRARLLREVLEQNRRDLSRLPAMGFADLLSAYLRARQEYSDLLVLAQSETRPPSWHTRIEAARQALSDAGRAIREQAGVHDPAFRSFMSDPTFPDIQSIAQIAPLVYLLATPVGGAALIVHAGGVQAVDLPELTEAALNGWLVETDAEGKNVTGSYLPAQLAVADWMPAALARLLPELGAKVMGPVLDALALPPGPLPSPTLREREEGEAGANTIILIPTGRLALLPLHAAQLPDGTHVIDHVTVCYAPSALALREARRHAAERRAAPLRLAGVGNPLPPVAALAELHQQLQAAAAALPDDPAAKELRSLVALPTGQLIHEGFELQRLIRWLPDARGDAGQQLRQLAAQWPSSLRYAKAELESVIDLLPASAATALYEQAATLAALRERMDGATALHLSCHGVFRADDPLESGLLLYNAAGQEERLTLRDLLDMEQTTLRHTRLATLSACQTAITDFRNLPEESIGLPAGFLQAGVPGVIGTLWSVDDAATALLVTRIYEYMQQEGLPAAQAVRRAQRWLRDVTAAELETYLERHEAIARARLESGRRMPVTLIEELFGKVTTAENPQQERPYASPHYWAPFTFTGAEEVRL